MQKDEKIIQLTAAQVLLSGKELLTKRPEGMPFEDYKVLLRTQSKLLKKLFKRKPSKRVAGLMPQRLGYNLHIR